MSFKNRIAKLSAGLAVAGLLAFAGSNTAEASTWEARTVEQVQQDILTTENGTTYTVQWGDTLGVISKAIDVPVEKLAAINDINNIDLIIAGNTLHVSADHSTVTYEEGNGKVSSYDVAQEQVVETAPQVAPTQEAAPVQQAPVEQAPVEQAAPAQQATTQSSSRPVQQTAPAQQAAPAQTGSEHAAKEWIAQRESNGSYTAFNPRGGYYGRYQLNPTLIHYGASPAEQEAAADAYVAGRYGSWQAAQSFWQANGWY